MFPISGAVGVWKRLAVRRTWAEQTLLSFRMEFAGFTEGGAGRPGCGG